MISFILCGTGGAIIGYTVGFHWQLAFVLAGVLLCEAGAYVLGANDK